MTPIPLARMDRNSRILITLFLLTMLVAFGVAGLNIYDEVGRSHTSIVARYGPQPVDRGGGSASLAALPAEDDPMMVRSNTFSQLLEVTHAHAFELPLILFVLAHFLMRSRVPDWFRLANYLASFGGVILFLAAPWLVRYVSIRTAFLFSIGAGMVLAAALAMTLVPMVDMWRKESPRQRTAPVRPQQLQ